jgi:uncharacterized protein YdeI (YjbR/CyaY-like superfamily)
MPTPNPTKTKTFSSSDELHQWLEAHHATESELWVKIFKKASNIPSITWDEIVIESLCWGWIDGIRKSLDDQSYLQRITPRKARSAWSKKNTEHIERLIIEGRMKESGLVLVRAAKADGRWDKAYASTREMQIPADFLEELDSNPEAKHFFETLNKSSRYVIAYRLETAKKPETRQKRFVLFMEMLARGEEPNFGFSKNKKQAE